MEVTFTGLDEWINADKDKISQVIVNLISNTIKYGKQGGQYKKMGFYDVCISMGIFNTYPKNIL